MRGVLDIAAKPLGAKGRRRAGAGMEMLSEPKETLLVRVLDIGAKPLGAKGRRASADIASKPRFMGAKWTKYKSRAHEPTHCKGARITCNSKLSRAAS